MIASMQRKKYDSFIVWLYNQNKENLIPTTIKNEIPYSTASGWRNLEYSNYFGYELRQIQSEALAYYELFENYKNLKRAFHVVSKVWINVSKVIMPILNQSKKHLEMVVNEIQRLFTVFPKKMAYKLTHISPSVFRERLNQIKVKCGLSPLSLCLKRHPFQLSTNEVKKIKLLFEAPELKCWSALSLYYHGIRKKGLYISKSTFYNYQNILGLKRKWMKAEKKKLGIKAKKPNEYLHVDTTFWSLQDNIKAAIVFVSDNYSKMILGWSLALSKDAENVKAALQQTIASIHKYHPKHLTTVLVADGGSENHNLTIDELLQKTTKPEITKVIALKDISFSNSAVEAVNKIMKRYLRYYKPESFEKLSSCLEIIVKDYNENRPHGSLNGLSPMEYYTNALVDLDFKKQKVDAKTLRILENQKVNCENCKQS